MTGPESRTPQDDAEVDDAALVAALQAGDDEAYARMLRLYGGRMLAVARRFMRIEADAFDVVQDAALSAFRAIGGFQGGSRLSSWLHRIVVNAALMKLRHRRSRPEQSIEELLPSYSEDGHRLGAKPAWAAPEARGLEQREVQERVRGAIDRLPADYRTILLLRDIEELSTEETAKMLELSIANVKTRLHRARQALRTMLEGELT